MVSDSKRVLLGVTGGIACYKALELVRLLKETGFDVRVVMTSAATEFVTPLSFQTLSGHPVATDLFSLTQESEIGHINLADTSDLVVIAPATANVLGKIASGIADDLLTTVVLATQAPILLAPSMNVHMLANPLVQENLAKLRAVNYHVMEAASGSLACGYEGKGRLPEPLSILEEVVRLLGNQDLDMSDERVLITAGPSHEPLDPVRYLSNRSSGKMGYALARAALRRGARVTLVSGPTSLVAPPEARLVRVVTAVEMRNAVLAELPHVTIVVMAAAVADYRPCTTAPTKIKRSGEVLQIELMPNPDILKEVVANKQGQVVIGFAAETEDLVENARQKLERKQLDAIVANDVTEAGSGFDVDTNKAILLGRDGATISFPLMSKDELADKIYDYVVEIGNSVRGKA
jgi:phosphopantothenoylcysteine decarboxylase/phosphopantothenate--cysteine ligase